MKRRVGVVRGVAAEALAVAVEEAHVDVARAVAAERDEGVAAGLELHREVHRGALAEGAFRDVPELVEPEGHHGVVNGGEAPLHATRRGAGSDARETEGPREGRR